MEWSSQVSEFSLELQELGSLEVQFMVQLLDGLLDSGEVPSEVGGKKGFNGVGNVR